MRNKIRMTRPSWECLRVDGRILFGSVTHGRYVDLMSVPRHGSRYGVVVSITSPYTSSMNLALLICALALPAAAQRVALGPQAAVPVGAGPEVAGPRTRRLGLAQALRLVCHPPPAVRALNGALPQPVVARRGALAPLPHGVARAVEWVALGGVCGPVAGAVVRRQHGAAVGARGARDCADLGAVKHENRLEAGQAGHLSDKQEIRKT